VKQLAIVIGTLCVLLLTGCKDDVASAGAGALTADEEVRVRSGVLSGMVSSSDSVAEFSINQTPDSFLLGEVNTATWATIKADLLTQFAYPVEFTYPKGSQIDSIQLMMTCSSWFAEGNSPLRVSVYEMDRTPLYYDSVYSSSVDLNRFWSGNDSTHVVKEDQIVVAAQPKEKILSSSESKYYPVIRFKMTDAFVRKMNSKMKFRSQQDFNNFFKGLYITTTWGASTALYVGNITMIMYYHYSYEGSTTPAYDTKLLYANTEVRQVNRYSFPNKNKVVDAMQQNKDTNYVISPGYVYTVLKLPLEQYVDTIIGRMRRDAEGDTLQPYINKALMRVDVLNVATTSTTSDKWADPASDMLLILRDSLQSFFTNRNLPSADYCLLGSLKPVVNSDYSMSYYYDFDMSTMLYNEVKRKIRGGATVGSLDMVMVPVHVEYSSSSTTTTTVSLVKLNQTITYTAIHSAQFKDNPLDIDVVCSGFTINSLH